MPHRWDCSVLSSLLLALTLVAPAPGQGREPWVPASERAEPLAAPFSFEGILLAPDGSSAEGAVVVTSAGGRAVAAGGAYRLEALVPLTAERVRVTAFGGQGSDLVASVEVVVPLGVRAVHVGPLRLTRGTACAASWIPTFGAEPGVSGDVYAMAVFDDGQGPALYLGGRFTSAGGVAAANIVRWDGTSWSALAGGLPAVGGGVHALAVHDDGSGPALYAAGSFGSGGGAPGNSVARWDGTSWSALGSGTGGSIEALVVHDDGSGPALYAGGSFTTAGGMPASRIARWNGSGWSALGSGMNNHVLSLAVFDDGGGPALYAGGQFTTAGGGPASRIARWDGASWSALGSGTDGQVSALATYDDGGGPALYAAGSFATAGGLAAGRIARWDGSTWAALGSGVDATVEDLAVFDDGGGAALYVAGSFDTAGGIATSGVARWDGSWSAVGTGLTAEARALAVFDDGSGPALWAGGDSTEIVVDGRARSTASWQGSSWSVVDGGLDVGVQDALVFDDGNGPALFVAGAFSGHGSVSSRGILRWDGVDWTSPGGGMDSTVNALCVFDDGGGPALFATGFFSSAGGVGAARIARWDGTSWSPLASGLTGTFGFPAFFGLALQVFDDGSGPALYVGGSFRFAGGVTCNGIARWDGAAFSALGSGIENFGAFASVESLASFDDGSGPALYAGGHFEQVGGVTTDGIARWNGASWSQVGGPDGAGDDVFAFEVADLGGGARLYVGGDFTSPEGVAEHLAVWDGSAWSEVGGGTDGSVHALRVHDDGDGPALYVGGLFTEAGGLAAARVARWNGSVWSALGGGMSGGLSGYVETFAVFDDGDGPALVAGGAFTRANDSGDSFLAKWWCPDTVAPVIACPEDRLVGDRIGSPPGEVVTFAVSATDARDPAPVITCVPPSGHLFPPGRTRVTCTAMDAAGNSAECHFFVTVARGVRR